MESNVVLVPGTGCDTFVDLSARSTQGQLFKKQILHMGKHFYHKAVPGGKLLVTKQLGQRLIDNFKSGVGDIVQVPIVDATNTHTEDPTRNIGEVVDVTMDDKGVYAIIDARKKEYADQLGKTLIGASALMHLNYRDTETDQQVGPTLLHVAVTNRPHITKLDGFEEFVAASADPTLDGEMIVLSDQQEEAMELDDMLESLRNDHGIDVQALQEQVTALSAQPNSNEILEALGGVLSEVGGVALSANSGEMTIKDVADAVIELAGESSQRQDQIEQLLALANAQAEEAATTEVEARIKEGRILPKQRERMIALAREDREAYDDMLPDSAIVSLSALGVTSHDEPEVEKTSTEVARLIELTKNI